MNTHGNPTDRTGPIDLSALDPASSSRGDRAASFAAQQLLTRIMETPRTVTNTVAADGNAQAPRRLNPRRVITRRPWTLAGGAAAVAIGATIVSASLMGGDPAFASWTPTPATVAPAEAADQQAECLAAGTDPQGKVRSALTERRGDFTFTLVATDQAVVECLLLDAALIEATGQEEQGAITGGSTSDLPVPPVDGTSVLWGASFSSPAGDYTSAMGRIGSDVVAVQLTPGSASNIQASVGDGYFTAWWPGQPNRQLTVTTTLTDGTQETRTLQRGDS